MARRSIVRWTNGDIVTKTDLTFRALSHRINYIECTDPNIQVLNVLIKSICDFWTN